MRAHSADFLPPPLPMVELLPSLLRSSLKTFAFILLLTELSFHFTLPY